MSIKVMTNVWDYSRASGTPLLVLLKLADWADDAGECWPSIATIAEKCRLKDERHVKRLIRDELEQRLGEVVVIPNGGRSSIHGGPRSNRYRITVHMPDDNDADEAPRVVEGPPSENSQHGRPRHPRVVEGHARVVEGPPEPSLDTSVEPSKTNNRLADEFESVWMAYPKKVDGVRGFKAYSDRRRAGASFEEIRSAVRHYAVAMRGIDPRYVKHCATFLGPDKPYLDFIDGLPAGAVSGPKQSESMQTVDRVLAMAGGGVAEIGR